MISLPSRQLNDSGDDEETDGIVVWHKNCGVLRKNAVGISISKIIGVKISQTEEFIIWQFNKNTYWKIR